MESKRKYTKVKKSNQMERNDIDVLKRIVDMVLVTNIMTKRRERYVVEGRMIYAKILREYGYSLSRIGGALAKDHTTVIHYMTTIDKLMQTDPEIVKKYNKCKDMFILEKGPTTQLTTEAELRNEIFRLNTKIEILCDDKDELKKEIANLKKESKVDDKRLSRIVKFIDENTPIGSEYITERKIRKIFDE